MNAQPASHSPAAGLPEFQSLTAPGGNEVRLRFQGPFAGSQVTWNAHFMTRQHSGESRNSITIGDETDNGRPLRVILDVPAFDLITIHKTIIMVRQYKRLRPGRHEFGV